MCALFTPEIVQAGAMKWLTNKKSSKRPAQIPCRSAVPPSHSRGSEDRTGDSQRRWRDRVVGKYRPRIRAGLLPLPGWRIPNPGRLQWSEAPRAAHLHRCLDLTLWHDIALPVRRFPTCVHAASAQARGQFLLGGKEDGGWDAMQASRISSSSSSDNNTDTTTTTAAAAAATTAHYYYYYCTPPTPLPPSSSSSSSSYYYY